MICGIARISSGAVLDISRSMSGSANSDRKLSAKALPEGVAKKAFMSASCATVKRRAKADARPARTCGSACDMMGASSSPMTFVMIRMRSSNAGSLARAASRMLPGSVPPASAADMPPMLDSIASIMRGYCSRIIRA